MKNNVGALCVIAMLAGSVLSLFAQGGQPSQPGEPTAQSPATTAPTTPPTFPTSEAKAQPNRADAKVYMGTIVNTGNSYVLKSANEEYLLDSQTKSQEVPRERRPGNGYARQGKKVDSCQTNQGVTIHVRRFEERQQAKDPIRNMEIYEKRLKLQSAVICI